MAICSIKNAMTSQNGFILSEPPRVGVIWIGPLANSPQYTDCAFKNSEIPTFLAIMHFAEEGTHPLWVSFTESSSKCGNPPGVNDG